MWKLRIWPKGPATVRPLEEMKLENTHQLCRELDRQPPPSLVRKIEIVKPSGKTVVSYKKKAS